MDITFNAEKLSSAFSGKSRSPLENAIGRAVIECVETGTKYFEGSLELDVTKFITDRIATVHDASFHEQLHQRMAMHNEPITVKQDLTPPFPPPPRKRGRPKKENE